MSDDADALSSDDDDGGGAGWIMTFADLMSLLMCFFVLLLSFSEMDVLKFKRLAGSMHQAFGVQAAVPGGRSAEGHQHHRPGIFARTPGAHAAERDLAENHRSSRETAWRSPVRISARATPASGVMPRR